MISSLAILDGKASILVHYEIKSDVGKKEIDQFINKISSNIENAQLYPIINIGGGCNFFHVSEGSLIFVASTRINPNALLIISFLYKFIRLLKHYFTISRITEGHIRKNLVFIHKLIDEVIDFGFPQILEIDVLRKYILQSGDSPEVIENDAIRKLTVQATGATSWRTEGIVYRKNEAYVDVIEFVNVLISKQGQVLSSDITGRIILRCQLSGIPECKFGLNENIVIPTFSDNKAVSNSDEISLKDTSSKANHAIALDNIHFHQCVRITSQMQGHTITFIPPDGTFELISYRTTRNIRLPFSVLPTIVERNRTRVEYLIKFRSTFASSGAAINIVMKIPCPKAAARADMIATSGKVKLEPAESALFWKIRWMSGQTQTMLKGTVYLAVDATETVWVRSPITLDFHVPMFTASGTSIRFLKVYEKSNYKTSKWIRYITRAGQYQIRI